jgi:5-methylcytosine-specific restriction endonuclease McrA
MNMPLGKNKNNRWCLIVEEGTRFGHLTVIKEVPPVYRNNRNWRRFECLCECGNIHISTLNGLRSGKAARCPKCKTGVAYYNKIYFTEEDKAKALTRYRQKYYRTHIEECALRSKKWVADNPEKARHVQKTREYRERGATGSHTYTEWVNVKYEYGFMCPYCLRQEPEIILTKDHIIPLSKGGSNDIDNIQPLCFSCNASKGTKIEENVHTHLFRFSDDFHDDGFDKVKYITDHLNMMKKFTIQLNNKKPCQTNQLSIDW